MTASRFVRWWQANRETVNERRRAKYKNDKEFREKERARKRFNPQQGRKRRFPKPKIYYHKGEPIILWSVGRVAEYLGISKRTIANLESKGSIPTNRVVDDLRRRWWPEAYVKWLKPFVDHRKSKEITAREFSRRVWNGWRQALATGTFPVLSEVNEHDKASNSQERRGCSLEDAFGRSPSGDKASCEPHCQDQR